MDPIAERIDAWEQRGLLDPATAARLRADSAPAPAADELETLPAAGATEPDRPDAHRGSATVAAVFGPGVTIPEMFGYLGVGFLLTGLTTAIIRSAARNGDVTETAWGTGLLAVGLVVLAFALGQGGPRRRRAAGVALLVALGYAAETVSVLLGQARLDPIVLLLLDTLIVMVLSIAFRLLRPGLLTAFGAMLGITAFGWAVIGQVQSLAAPRSFGGLQNGGTASLAVALLGAAGWLLVGFVLGVVALAEEDYAPDPQVDPIEHAAAGRRASLIRAWAGLVAVLGLSSALRQMTFGVTFERVVPPWLGELAILALSVFLVERAFRRDSSAFLFAAAVGFTSALTDFCFAYVTSVPELGLLLVGAILLGVGVATTQLRRRLPGQRPPVARPPAGPPEDPPPPTTPAVAEAPSDGPSATSVAGGGTPDQP